MVEQPPSVILFDGVCNLCNGFVNFLIDQDKDKRFRFASLQSDFGKSILEKYHLPTQNFQSVVVLEHGVLFTKSAAVFKVIESLPRWRWVLLFNVLPNFLLDGIYGLIARNRYRIFGKQSACRVPTPELRERFLG